MAKVLSGEIVVCEVEHQSRYNIHFWSALLVV